MFGSRFKWVVILLLVNGVLLEVDHAYKISMHRDSFVMPIPSNLRLPKQFHNSPLAETPFVQSYDGMLMTSGTVIFEDN